MANCNRISFGAGPANPLGTAGCHLHQVREVVTLGAEAPNAKIPIAGGVVFPRSRGATLNRIGGVSKPWSTPVLGFTNTRKRGIIDSV